MSDKNLGDAGRWRSKTVAFRVSPEEADLIDAQVAMSGLTKQDYITKRLLARDVVVVPSSAATLNITGRDVKDQEFSVRFVDCRWELVEKVSDEELEARAVPAVVHSVIAFVNGRQAPSWCGTASDLLAAVGGNVRANVLSKYLNEHSGYMESQGVAYSRRKTGGEKLICLERRAMKVDGDDGSGI